VVAVRGEVKGVSPGQVTSFVQVGREPQDQASIWMINADLTLIERPLAVGDKVQLNRDEPKGRTDGEVLAIDSGTAWVRWPKYQHETWRVQDLKVMP
jgi:hypothetical protein